MEKIVATPGNITKKDVENKIKELKANTEGFEVELSILKKYLHLTDEQAKIKNQIKQNEQELDDKLLKKYSELAEEDVKRLIVENKWLAHIRDDINDELDNIILNLTSRIKELAERYAETIPQLEQEVNEYEQRVKEHLKVMGFEL